MTTTKPYDAAKRSRLMAICGAIVVLAAGFAALDWKTTPLLAGSAIVVAFVFVIVLALVASGHT